MWCAIDLPVELDTLDKLDRLLQVDPAYDLNSTPYYGKTLLHVCCINAKTDMIQRLMSNPSVDVNKECDGMTPVMEFINPRWRQRDSWLEEVEDAFKIMLNDQRVMLYRPGEVKLSVHGSSSVFVEAYLCVRLRIMRILEESGRDLGLSHDLIVEMRSRCSVIGVKNLLTRLDKRAANKSD